jgi:hypothetical protein
MAIPLVWRRRGLFPGATASDVGETPLTRPHQLLRVLVKG